MIPERDTPIATSELYKKAIDTFGEEHQVSKHASESAEYSSRVSQLACDMMHGADVTETLKEAAEEYVDSRIVTEAQFFEVLERKGLLHTFLGHVDDYLPVALKKLQDECAP